MKRLRAVCLVVTAVVVLVCGTREVRGARLCCIEYANWCYSQCYYHGGIFLIDCPFPSFELCVCEDMSTPVGGPDCPILP